MAEIPQLQQAIASDIAAREASAAAATEAQAIYAQQQAQARQVAANPQNFANVPISEIAARYGTNTAESIRDYYSANPSARFKSEIEKYAIERNAVVGPAGRMAQDYYNPTPSRGPSYSEQVNAVMYGAKVSPAAAASPAIVKSTPIAPEAKATSAFDTASEWLRTAPVLGSVYSLGTGFQDRAVDVATVVKTAPVLSTVYTGGRIYEGRADVAAQQQLASDIYSQDISKGYITDGKFTGPDYAYKTLSDSTNLANTMAGNQKALESSTPLGKQNVPVTMPLADWATGASQYITNAGSGVMKSIDAALPAISPVTHFAVGVGEGVASLVPFAALAIPAIEWGARNPAALAVSVVPGAVAQGTGMAKQAAEDPFKFAGTFVGQVVALKGLGVAYEAQPYRIGFEKATIISSSGESAPSAKYTSLAVSKMSGADYQIAQVKQALIGVGGKAVSPIETVMGSELLKTTTGARFATKENTFAKSPVQTGRVLELGPDVRIQPGVTDALDIATKQQIFGSAPIPHGINYRFGFDYTGINLPYSKGTFEKVVSSYSLGSKGQDLSLISSELSRVVAPGGKVEILGAMEHENVARALENVGFKTRIESVKTPFGPETLIKGEMPFGSELAMKHFNEVAESQRNFYHATTTGNLGETLLSTGKITIQESHPGGMFFAEPETILTKYATGPGVPIALKLTDVPKISPEYLNVVSEVKAGRAGAFGPEFVKTTAKLPEGFYPGIRPAAGKAFGTYGLEEEYIVTPGTSLYLKSLRSMAGPSGEKWLLAEVSMKKPLIPDVVRGVVQTIADIKNLKLTAGVPEVPKEYFEFGEGKTFAAQTPLETSIVKRLAPTETPKINLGYGVQEITSGSGMRLQNAATAINEVVRANKFPNPGKVTEAILQTEIDYGVKMYGSSIQRGAGTETGITTLTRAPNDIDVYVPEAGGKPMGPSFASDVTAAINRAAGRTVVELDPTGTVSLKNGNKLFDIHNENPTELELLAQGSNPNKPGSLYYGIGMKPEKFLETTEGIGVMTYSEQVGRKLSGTSEFTPTPRSLVSKVYEGGPEEFTVSGQIAPRFEGRMKDIPDFYTGQKGSIGLMERSLNPVTRYRAQQANTMLEQWLNQWGEGTAKNVRENYEFARISGTQKYAIDLSRVGKYEIESSPASAFVKSAGISPSTQSYSESISISAPPPLSPGLETSQGFSQSIFSRSPSTIIEPSFSPIPPSEQVRSMEPSISPSINIRVSPEVSAAAREFYESSYGIPEARSTSPAAGIPSITSTFLSGIYPSVPYIPPSYVPSQGYQYPSPPGSPSSPPEYPSLTQYRSPSSPPLGSGQSMDLQKKKRKPQSYFLFREILPMITPIEEIGGFKSGKPFFRAIGNQQILEVRPQKRDWLHAVDIDVDIRELEQTNKNSSEKTSDMAGVNFFRTATKQEKAKTGKPIITYTPTKQELDMATLTGIRTKRPKPGRNRLW
jgi:hypothetical protein